MDALSEVLREAHLAGGVFFHADLFEPWCIAARLSPEHCSPFLGPTSHLIPYHYVVEGLLNVRVDGQEAVTLRAGEVLLLPGNDLHVLGSDIALPPVSAAEIIRPSPSGDLASIRYGGDGSKTRIICGFLASGGLEYSPILSTLPRLLTLDIARAKARSGFARPSPTPPTRSARVDRVPKPS